MRKIFFSLVICVLASCVRTVENTDTHDEVENYSPSSFNTTSLGKMIGSLIKEMPYATNNEVTREMFVDSIKAKYQTYEGEFLPYLVNNRYSYVDCDECTNGENKGKFIVEFRTVEFMPILEIDKVLKIIGIVIGVVERDDMLNLVEKGDYYLGGTFNGYGNNSNNITGRIFRNGNPSLKSEGDIINLYLGTVVLDNLTFTPINNGNN